MTKNDQPEPRTIDLAAATQQQLLTGGGGKSIPDSTFVTRLTAELYAGRPAVTRFDPELPDAQLRALLRATAGLLGRLVPQDASGDLLVDVRDTQPADIEAARGYQSNGPILLHTDPTEILAMLCLNSAPSGGTTLLRQAQDVYEHFARRDPEQTDLYLQDWCWTLPAGSSDHTGPAEVTSPVLTRTGHEVAIQYSSRLLRQGIGDDEQRQLRVNALDAFDQLNEPANCVMLTLHRGECLWIDNYRTLHGRTAFHDGDQSRHLVRAWLWRHDAYRRPPAFRSLARAFHSDEQVRPGQDHADHPSIGHRNATADLSRRP